MGFYFLSGDESVGEYPILRVEIGSEIFDVADLEDSELSFDLAWIVANTMLKSLKQ